MVSVIAPTLILMTALSQGITADEQDSSEKIIIHVPYKIHSHLHTHTNYKIIKVPQNNIDKLEEQNTNEDHMKYLDQEIETILSGSKLPNIIKHTESQFQPQTFPMMDPKPSSVPMHAYHEFKEFEHFHSSQEEPAPQHLISLTTRLPTMAPTYHTSIPDNKYSEGKLYYHAFSTKPVPFYNPPIANPTYQVIEEKGESHEKIPHHIVSHESHEKLPHNIVSHEKFVQSNGLPKSGKETFSREFIQKIPFSTRSGKVSTTTKPVKLPLSTKLYSMPTKSTKTFAVPTNKSFVIATTKKPRAIITKNNEEYEHIGYLVVGENSQKFVTVNPKKINTHGSVS